MEISSLLTSILYFGACFGSSLVFLVVFKFASNSVSMVDFVTWAAIALIAQLLAFALVRFFFLPLIVERIKSNEVSAGTMLGATSIAVGLLNAACMTY